MPAAMRGAGRSPATARSKSSAGPNRSRGAKPAAGAARANFAISPKLLLIGGGVALAGAAALLAFTDHRAERMAGAAETAFIDATGRWGLRLAHVSLEGASSKSVADILRAADLPAGAPLLGLDLEAARQRIERVGWVKSATVMRLYPNSVVVAVKERRLLAVWQHDGRAGVIDADGAVASGVDPGGFPSLPLVVGEGANLAAADILPLVLSRPRIAARLDALVRVDDRRWDLRLRDGGLIQLPASDVEAALIRLDQLDQQSRILELGFSRIDLRDPEMVLVRPRRGPAAQVSDGAG